MFENFIDKENFVKIFYEIEICPLHRKIHIMGRIKKPIETRIRAFRFRSD